MWCRGPRLSTRLGRAQQWLDSMIFQGIFQPQQFYDLMILKRISLAPEVQKILSLFPLIFWFDSFPSTVLHKARTECLKQTAGKALDSIPHSHRAALHPSHHSSCSRQKCSLWHMCIYTYSCFHNLAISSFSGLLYASVHQVCLQNSVWHFIHAELGEDHRAEIAAAFPSEAALHP